MLAILYLLMYCRYNTYLLEKYYPNPKVAALLKIDINFILQGWDLLTWEDIQMAFKCLHFEIISSLIWHFVRIDGFCKLAPTTGFQLCGNSWRKSGSRTYRIKGHFKIFLGCYDLPMCNREKTIIWFLIPIMIFRSKPSFQIRISETANWILAPTLAIKSFIEFFLHQDTRSWFLYVHEATWKWLCFDMAKNLNLDWIGGKKTCFPFFSLYV